MPAATRRALVAHAEAEAPNEACGILLLRDGVAVDYRPGENLLESPYRFALKPGGPHDVFAEDEGYEIAIFHTHPETRAKPSRTDVANAGEWARYPQVIYSIAHEELRAWRYENNGATELDLESS